MDRISTSYDITAVLAAAVCLSDVGSSGKVALLLTGNMVGDLRRICMGLVRPLLITCPSCTAPTLLVPEMDGYLLKMKRNYGTN